MTTRRVRPVMLVAVAALLTLDVSGHGYARAFFAEALLTAQGTPAATPATATPPDVEWKTYGASLASTRYSPLDQINAGNFDTLQVAWRFKTDSLGPTSETNLEATPLMAGGVIYSRGGIEAIRRGPRRHHG